MQDFALPMDAGYGEDLSGEPLSDEQCYSITALSQSAWIPDDVWKNLSKDERKAWASIGTDTCALIMDSGTRRQVHMAVTNPSDASPADTTSPPDTELSVHATKAATPRSKKTTFATSQERTDTLNKAQSGDPRRVLSHPPRDFPQGGP
jgi:hypothetical protein